MRFVSDYIAPKVLILGIIGFLLVGDGLWGIYTINEFQATQTILLYTFTGMVVVGGGLSTPRDNVTQMILGYLGTLLIIPVGHWMWNGSSALMAPFGIIPIAGLLALPLTGRLGDKLKPFLSLMGCGTIVFLLSAFLIGGPYIAFIPTSVIYASALLILVTIGPRKTPELRHESNDQVG